MRILGIDPGTLVMGYGVIDSCAGEMNFVCCNAITCAQRSPMGERLCHLFDEITKVITLYHPDVVAVEQPFVAKNVKTALAIGKAQAIAILAGSRMGLTVYEYTPAQIKQTVTNYGSSSKEQVQEMIKLQLGLAQIPQPNDAADALAVAICHLREIHLKDILAQQGGGR